MQSAYLQTYPQFFPFISFCNIEALQYIIERKIIKTIKQDCLPQSDLDLSQVRAQACVGAGWGAPGLRWVATFSCEVKGMLPALLSTSSGCCGGGGSGTYCMLTVPPRALTFPTPGVLPVAFTFPSKAEFIASFHTFIMLLLSLKERTVQKAAAFASEQATKLQKQTGAWAQLWQWAILSWKHRSCDPLFSQGVLFPSSFWHFFSSNILGTSNHSASW